MLIPDAFIATALILDMIGPLCEKNGMETKPGSRTGSVV